jgi:hypothetical protein
MRAFAEAWSEEPIVQAPLAQITWYHNLTLLEKLKNPEERLWYAQQTIAHGWSRDVLVHQIESGLYHRQGKAVTNFERTPSDSICSPRCGKNRAAVATLRRGSRDGPTGGNWFLREAFGPDDLAKGTVGQVTFCCFLNPCLAKSYGTKLWRHVENVPP